jgi:phage terminase small subunit
MDADTTPPLQDTDDQHVVDQHRADYQQAQPFITPAMQAFAEHWAYSRNQIKAYRHAYPGSSVSAAKANARRLFADDRVHAEIRRVLERWTDLSSVKLERIEHQLARVAFADPRLLYDASGNLLPPHQWDADTAAAVASYSETPTKYGTVRKVRMHDLHAAARTLAEMKGAFEKNKAPPGCRRAFKFDQLCALNFDQGLLAVSHSLACG